MDIAIVGSRAVNKEIAYKIIEQHKHLLFIEKENTIITGGAVGVDKAAELYAINNNIKVIVFMPDYNMYPSFIAPLKRNDEIIKVAQLIFIIWDEKSTGTNYVIKNCNKKNKNFYIYSTIQNKIINQQCIL